MMAQGEKTTTANNTSSLSSEAYDLLACFTHGFDGLVLRVAEQVARERKLGAKDAVGPVDIEAEDVKSAGDHVISAIRAALSAGNFANELDPSIVDCMEECIRNTAESQ